MNAVLTQFQLGCRAKDLVTGVEGTLTGRVEWLSGCVQFVLKPPADKDMKPVEAFWVDWQQLQWLDAGISATIVARKAEAPQHNGGPSPFERLPTSRG